MSQQAPTAYVPLSGATVASNIATRALLSAMTIPNAIDGMMFFCSEAGIQSLYTFSLNSGAVVDGTNVLATTVGGASRWLRTGANASGGLLYFNIQDYRGKADSGITDNSGPMRAMLQDALAKGYGGAICHMPYDPRFPGGYYGFNDAVGTFVYNAVLADQAWRLFITGDGAAAPVGLRPGLASKDWIVLSGNLSQIFFREITFVSAVPAVDNCSRLIAMSGNTIGEYYVDDCAFYGIGCSAVDSGMLYHALTHLTVRRCLMVACSNANGTKSAPIFGSQSLGMNVEDVIMIGDDGFRGAVYGMAAPTAAGISLQGQGAYPLLGAGNWSCRISRVDIGFQYSNGVLLEGLSNVNRLSTVILEDVTVDVGNVNYLDELADPGAGITVNHADVVECNSCFIGGSAYPLAMAARFLDAGSVFVKDLFCQISGQGGLALTRSANRIVVDRATLSFEIVDSQYTFLDTECPINKITKNGKTTTISQDALGVGTMLAQTEDVTILPTVAGGGGVGLIDVQTAPDALSTFIAKVRGSKLNSGFRDTESAAFDLVGDQATLATAVAGSANPATYGDNVSDAAAFGVSTAVWTPGAGANSRSGRLSITNNGAAVNAFIATILKELTWGKFSPAQIAGFAALGDFVIEIWDPSSIVQVAGAVTAWQGRLGRCNLTQANPLLQPIFVPAAHAGLDGVRFTGMQRLEGTLPASASAYAQGSACVSGTVEANGSCLLSMSSSAVAMAAGAVEFVQRADEIRAEFTGGNNAALAAIPDAVFRKFACRFFASAAKVYRDGAPSTQANPLVTPVAGASLFVGMNQAGADGATGTFQTIVLLSQSAPESLLAKIAGWAP